MKNKVLIDGKGEIRADNYMVVAPGCYAIDKKKGHEGSYTIAKDLPIMQITEGGLLELLKPYLRKKTTPTTTTKNNEQKDESRSGREFREVIKLIGQEKSKQEVFDEMSAFSKWVSAPEQYKELTYQKAKNYVLSQQLHKKDSKKKSEEENDPIEYKYLPEILNNPIPEPKWRVEDFVPESGITYLASPPGEGKTMVGIHMSLSIASGREFLGRKTLPGKLIYFDSENGEICLYDRFKRIAKGHDFEDKEVENIAISIYPYIRFDLDNDVSFDLLNEFYMEFKPDVMVFDSLIRFMEGSENDAESCKMVFDFLKKFHKDNPNLTIIILHHLTKNNQGGMNALRGSSELAASAASIVMLKRLPYAYKLSVEKSRYLDMSQKHELYYNLTDNEQGLFFDTCEGKEDMPSDAVGRATQDFWKWAEDKAITDFSSKTCQEYLKTKGHSKNAVYELLRGLDKEGYIIKLTRGHYEIKNTPFATEEEVKED